MADFSKWRCRASCLGNLMVEPKDKGAKERGDLSETAKTYLISAYIKEKYSREENISTRQMEKGTLCEPGGIALFNQVEGKEYKKNHKRLFNDWFVGSPDLFLGETIEEATEIYDDKCPWSLNTFLSNLTKPLNSLYYAQIQAYFDLTGVDDGGVVYTLVNAPENMITDELYYLARRMGVIDVSVPPKEYEIAAAKIELSMKFDDIDPKERVLKFPVTRDNDFIERAKAKVAKGRIFLQELEEKHLNFNHAKQKS